MLFSNKLLTSLQQQRELRDEVSGKISRCSIQVQISHPQYFECSPVQMLHQGHWSVQSWDTRKPAHLPWSTHACTVHPWPFPTSVDCLLVQRWSSSIRSDVRKWTPKQKEKKGIFLIRTQTSPGIKLVPFWKGFKKYRMWKLKTCDKAGKNVKIKVWALHSL